MPVVDLAVTSRRELNAALHALAPDTDETFWRVENPMGQHALAVGLDAAIAVEIAGHAGYYCAGMNQQASVVIDGDASARCGISMKGVDIVVKGSIGPMSAFMAQSGTLVALGDAGDALGDSIYEARLFVRGSVKSLGADCVEKEMRPEHFELLARLLDAAGVEGVAPSAFKRYGSARTLYNFHVDNAAAY
jgi:glutamate synthase domain-containing protein 3